MCHTPPGQAQRALTAERRPISHVGRRTASEGLLVESDRIRSAKRFSAHPLRGKFRAGRISHGRRRVTRLTRTLVRRAPVRFRFVFYACIGRPDGSRHRNVSGNVTVISSTLGEAAGTRCLDCLDLHYSKPKGLAQVLVLRSASCLRAFAFLAGRCRVLRGAKALEQAGANGRCPPLGRPRIVAGGSQPRSQAAARQAAAAAARPGSRHQ